MTKANFQDPCLWCPWLFFGHIIWHFVHLGGRKETSESEERLLRPCHFPCAHCGQTDIHKYFLRRQKLTLYLQLKYWAIPMSSFFQQKSLSRCPSSSSPSSTGVLDSSTTIHRALTSQTFTLAICLTLVDHKDFYDPWKNTVDRSLWFVTVYLTDGPKQTRVFW